MPTTIPAGAGLLPYLIPLVVAALVILRNARARTLRFERLWIAPAMILLVAGLVFAQSPPPGPIALAIDAAALVVGALLGWWRGRASRFTIDPATHVITSKVSPAGMLLILGIFATRYVLRSVMSDGVSAWHVSPIDIADSFFLLALGVVCAQRTEWWIRGRRMVAAARAGSVPDAP